MTLQQLQSRNKASALAGFRGALYAFLWYETGLSSTRIAKLVNRNHSTVILTAREYYHTIHNPKLDKEEIFRHNKIQYIREAYESIRKGYHALGTDFSECLRGHGNMAGLPGDEHILQSLLLQIKLQGGGSDLQQHSRNKLQLNGYK